MCEPLSKFLESTSLAMHWVKPILIFVRNSIKYQKAVALLIKNNLLCAFDKNTQR